MDILWLHFDGFVKPTNNEKKTTKWKMKNESKKNARCVIKYEFFVGVCLCVWVRARDTKHVTH